MTAHEVAVINRPHRRTHLAHPDTTAGVLSWCGRVLPNDDAHAEIIPLVGAGTRVKNDLVRTLDNNTCMWCTRIAYGMLMMYASRDTGVAW